MPDFIIAYSPGVWLSLLVAGIVIGLLAGLLGVGGGIVAVPVLVEVFEYIDVADPVILPLAVGTAHANVLVASLSAAHAHWRAGSIDRALVNAWLPALAIGAAIGLAIGSLAPNRALTGVFAVVAALLGVKLLLGDRLVLTRRQPQGAVKYVAPILVGGLASALGVGGGTLSTPVLSLYSFPIRRSIGAGALFNVIIALPATVAFTLQGWGISGRPADALGDIALFCVATLSLPALFVAPVAARWSARAPLPLLRRLFAVCLGAIALRLLLRI